MYYLTDETALRLLGACDYLATTTKAANEDTINREMERVAKLEETAHTSRPRDAA
jgi:hypothetical protein